MTAGPAIDERDISRPINWLLERRALATVEALKRKHINAQYVAGRKEALAALLAHIPEGAKVSRADSVTLDQIGIIAALRERGKNEIVWPQEKDGNGNMLHGPYEANPELYIKLQRDVFAVDVYMTGANAITMDGKIVSTDGGGNRIAPTIFGPAKVVYAIGVNKLVKNLDAALERIREFAAPVNVKRHQEMHHRTWYGELPCATTGVCTDCDHPRRICNYTAIIEGSGGRFKGRINVVLVGEELGM